MPSSATPSASPSPTASVSPSAARLRRRRRAAGRSAASRWTRRTDRRLLPRRRSRLLQRDLRRRPRPRDDLVAADELLAQHGRRQDLGHGADARRARRSSRDCVRPGRSESHHHRQRRRPLRDLRRHEDVAALHQPAAVAVLSRRPRTTRGRSTTSAAARRTTDRSAGRRARSTARASAPATGTASAAATDSSPASIPRIRTSSTPQSQEGALGRLDLQTGDPRGDPANAPEHSPVWSRCAPALRSSRPSSRPGAAVVAGGGGGRGADARAVALGLAADRQPAFCAPPLLRRRACVSQRRSRRLLDGRSARTSRATSIRPRSRSWARSGRPTLSPSIRRRRA